MTVELTPAAALGVLASVVFSLLVWSLKRHIDRADAVVADHETRIHRLEIDLARAQAAREQKQ